MQTIVLQFLQGMQTIVLQLLQGMQTIVIAFSGSNVNYYEKFE